ncbi:MAG: DUF3048 domain-containing protein [bacterium]|nr:DUF3048 domain-containing protein [bacterium]
MSPKQKKILLIVGIAAMLIAISILAYLRYYPSQKQTTKKETPKKESPAAAKPAEPPKPILAEAPLDGTMVDPSIANRHPLAIIIENHPQARPQTGLTDASIVYETLVEGGITRFMAIYGPVIPAKVGPVRSARTYYVDWAEEYDAFYAHWGGANDALHKIANNSVKDIDAMKIGQPYFWRDSSRSAPHNGYTTTAKLYEYSVKRGWPQTGSFTAYKFKDDAPVAERPASGTLSIDFSGNSTYAVKFTYNPSTNSFLRFQAGSPHKDRVSGVQIAPKNIVVQYVSEIYKSGKKDHDAQTIGSGNAKSFIDGKMTLTTWSKSSSKSRTEFKDSAGNLITFNRGQTWIAVVRPTAPVTFTP